MLSKVHMYQSLIFKRFNQLQSTDKLMKAIRWLLERLNIKWEINMRASEENVNKYACVNATIQWWVLILSSYLRTYACHAEIDVKRLGWSSEIDKCKRLRKTSVNGNAFILIRCCEQTLRASFDWRINEGNTSTSRDTKWYSENH